MSDEPKRSSGRVFFKDHQTVGHLKNTLANKSGDRELLKKSMTTSHLSQTLGSKGPQTGQSGGGEGQSSGNKK